MIRKHALMFLAVVLASSLALERDGGDTDWDYLFHVCNWPGSFTSTVWPDNIAHWTMHGVYIFDCDDFLVVG
jgi:hypothetical protein